jgi:glycerol-3-phosphate acyltransferase PlsX
VRIAVDAMGGDHAPQAPVEGALQALAQDEDLEVVLVGASEALTHTVPSSVKRVTVVETGDVISPDEPPVAAVRQKPEASLVKAIRLVAEGAADGMVSAGNTGALMAAGLMWLGRIEGVDRPALTAVLPTVDGRGVLLLDVGANTEAKPSHLQQFAWMGALYAEQVLARPEPRVALLNIGSEANKGPSTLRSAYQRLSRSKLLHFVGNLESRDLLAGAADVVVSDGFVGNIVLKAVEGTAIEMMHHIARALRGSLRAKLGGLMARPALMRVRDVMDYERVGGVPLLGLNGVVIKAHGSSGPRAFANAVARATEQARRRVGDLIAENLAREEAP